MERVEFNNRVVTAIKEGVVLSNRVVTGIKEGVVLNNRMVTAIKEGVVINAEGDTHKFSRFCRKNLYSLVRCCPPLSPF